MKKCEHFDKCIAFFMEQAKKLPATTHFMEATYCEVHNSRCARFAVYVAQGGNAELPLDLFPCQYVRGERLAKEIPPETSP